MRSSMDTFPWMRGYIRMPSKVEPELLRPLPSTSASNLPLKPAQPDWLAVAASPPQWLKTFVPSV